MYAIINKGIYEAEPIKESKRGTAMWCKIEGKKNKLISYSKLFDTEKEAETVLNNKIEAVNNKNKKLSQEEKEIEEIVFKIMDEFKISIKFLDRPCSIQEAKKLYNTIKQQKYMREV